MAASEARKPNRVGRRGPHPSISAEAIYACALSLLDSEGIQAITARRVAAELNISTRTLYKRVPNRECMLRNVLDMHYSAMSLEAPEGVEWEAAALDWCMALDHELTAHPHLTELLAHDYAPVLERFLDPLVELTVREGIPLETAVACSHSLLNVTIGDATRRTRAPRAEPELSATIGWILAGVRVKI